MTTTKPRRRSTPATDDRKPSHEVCYLRAGDLTDAFSARRTPYDAGVSLSSLARRELNRYYAILGALDEYETLQLTPRQLDKLVAAIDLSHYTDPSAIRRLWADVANVLGDSAAIVGLLRKGPLAMSVYVLDRVERHALGGDA